MTYLTWEAQAKDGKAHQVEVHFEASPEIAVNEDKQGVESVLPEIAGLAVLGFGTVDQPVLKKKGDDLRVDWGRFYIAVPGAELEAGGNTLRQPVWLFPFTLTGDQTTHRFPRATFRDSQCRYTSTCDS